MEQARSAETTDALPQSASYPHPMGSSRARYLFVKVLIPALLVNVVIATLAGIVTFPAGREVPIHGNVSAVVDTLLGSFFIGFLTMIGVAPVARVEARAGRVRGLGWKGAWLTWSPKLVLVNAALLGVVWLVLFGLPAAHALEARWPEAVPRDVYVIFKASFTGAAGVAAALVAALRGIAAENVPTNDPRWCRTPAAAALTYPCDYMDKGSLALTNRERGCNATPTWNLVVRGVLDPEHVKIALGDLAVRYPPLTTKVQSLDGVPPGARDYRYAQDPSFRIESIFDYVRVRDVAEAEAIVRERRSRHLDPFSEFLVSLTLVIIGDESCYLVFRQHHAIADGRAFFALLRDFGTFVNDARAGRRPTPDALAPVPRRGETEPLGLTPRKQALYTLAGIGSILRTRIRAVMTPLTPLHQNRSNDYSGENGTVFWLVDDAILTRWNAARKRFDVSLNTLLTGALMLANQRLHRAKGLPVGRTNAQLLMETRPRQKDPSDKAAFLSFGNHLTFLHAEADLGKVSDPKTLLTSLQKQVVQQIDRAMPTKHLLGERWFVLHLPLEELQREVFESVRPLYNLNFSNMIPLEFADLGGDGWLVEQILGTTPVAPRNGMALVCIRYHGKLVFNFNYKTTAATREFAEEMRAEFEKVMEDIT